MMTVIINGTEYNLATTLRVAYKIQGQHNHKPYTEVFKSMGDMSLEDQIGFIYAAFECANPEQAKFITRQKFQDYYLDNYNLKYLMNQMKELIQGIMGESDEDEVQEDQATESEGN